MLAFYFKKKINYLIKTVKRKYIKKKKTVLVYEGSYSTILVIGQLNIGVRFVDKWLTNLRVIHF